MTTDDKETAAYASGRGDQYEEDCGIVRLLFDELNDVDVMHDGFINTTRVREMLSHFDLPRPAECSCSERLRSECDNVGCIADHINTERERMIAAVAAQENKA